MELTPGLRVLHAGSEEPVRHFSSRLLGIGILLCDTVEGGDEVILRLMSGTHDQQTDRFLKILFI